MYKVRPAATLASLRKATIAAPEVERICKSIISRGLHVYPPKKAAARSPRVAAKERAANGTSRTVRVKKSYGAEECLPPLALLNSAHKSGALGVTPEQALDFLRRWQERAAASGLGWEQKLCSKHSITPSTVVLLARIVGKCEGKGQKLLGKELMYAASAMGERSATFSIVSTALRSGRATDLKIRAPLHQVGLLAKKEKDPQAMTLLGQVLFSQRADNEALDWFGKATSSGALDFDGAGEALVTKGRILLSRKDTEGATEAFKKAALELDDPTAYFYLSQLEDSNSQNQQVYLLKAATSGVLEAWHNLGVLELSKIDKRPKRPTSIKDYDMAREWFQVAAADGYGLSMLNLASIYKAVGQRDEGLRWLEKAEGVVGVSEQARMMKIQWAMEDQVSG
ncbi:hypothetical protein LZ554_007801 [Drepanopeziza brunnea f. sp. 'monogermtubi']|nr:hypothetical protein LZ554_007801 [Drepanopeziza brunnea f. sp. 'monogermtubi']